MALKNIEQLEYFHSRTLRLQHKLILFGETVSPKRLLLQYMRKLPKSDKLKEFIATKMADPITLLDNNGNSAVYIGENNRGIYHNLEMIVSLTTFTTSGQRYHHFGPSYSTNNDTATPMPVIASLRI